VSGLGCHIKMCVSLPAFPPIPPPPPHRPPPPHPPPRPHQDQPQSTNGTRTPQPSVTPLSNHRSPQSGGDTDKGLDAIINAKISALEEGRERTLQHRKAELQARQDQELKAIEVEAER
jgi:hypothetical protein